MHGGGGKVMVIDLARPSGAGRSVSQGRQTHMYPLFMSCFLPHVLIMSSSFITPQSVLLIGDGDG